MIWDVVVIGAGVSGLQCARDLQTGGRRVRVLERARGVGGRCATRRFDGQSVDFGPMFLHGHVEAFLEAVDRVDGATVDGWPRRVTGQGPVCQPDAFAPFERRVALVDGLSLFPKTLARDLEVVLQTQVLRIAGSDEGFVVHVEGGEPTRTRDLVLALPIESCLSLLADLPDDQALRSARSLLGMFASVPSLTVVAGYPLDTPQPGWDLRYPEDSDLIQLIGQDSTKRIDPRWLVMVYQARPAWSRQQLASDSGVWQQSMLDEASRLLGPWAATPSWTHPHRWRHARVDRGNELSQPLLLQGQGQGRLGLCGDIYAPGGGVQASWLSGQRLAQRLMKEE